MASDNRVDVTYVVGYPSYPGTVSTTFEIAREIQRAVYTNTPKRFLVVGSLTIPALAYTSIVDCNGLITFEGQDPAYSSIIVPDGVTLNNVLAFKNITVQCQGTTAPSITGNSQLELSNVILLMVGTKPAFQVPVSGSSHIVAHTNLKFYGGSSQPFIQMSGASSLELDVFDVTTNPSTSPLFSGLASDSVVVNHDSSLTALNTSVFAGTMTRTLLDNDVDLTLMSGVSGSRPTFTTMQVGLRYFDTTLGIPIWWNGTTWVNASGTSV